MAGNAAPEPTFGRKEALLALLAMASASSDVLSFLVFHQVFTSAMTGNTALLGSALGQGQAPAAAHAAVALGSFIGGVAIGTLAAGEGRQSRALALVLALEALCLTLFAALWYSLARPADGGSAYPLILLSALAMGLQIVAARQVNLPGIPTVVVTSTLTSFVVNATLSARRGEALPVHAWRQAAIVLSYAAGALAAGAAAALRPGLFALLPLAAVLTALVLQVSAPRPPAG